MVGSVSSLDYDGGGNDGVHGEGVRGDESVVDDG